MSRNRLLVPIILTSLLALAGCGGSSSRQPVPPPSGAFSNADLNGTYTFSLIGADSSGTFLMAGTLTACGCSRGIISGGTVSLSDISGDAPGSTISSGTYDITKDGRGFAQLLITTLANQQLEVDLDLVLTSGSHGLITRYDSNGTGSGTIDLQPSSVSQSSIAKSWAFSLSGVNLTSKPLAVAGSFTLDSAGNIVNSGNTLGVADFNLYLSPAVVSSNLALSGFVQVGATAPGLASLATSFSQAPLTFDVYAVDSSHLKLVENDGQSIMVGDAFAQPSFAFPTGTQVFSMAGPDNAGNPLVSGGVFSADANGNITNGLEDVNDDGIVDGGTNPATPQNFTGTYVDTGDGRFEITLSGFTGGTNFVGYPSSGGLLLLEVDSGLNAGITGGYAVPQTSTTFASSQGYGMNYTGADLFNAANLDAIAQFNTSGSVMKGLLDVNDGGSLSTDNVNGTFSVDANGFGSATFVTGPPNVFFYVVDSSTSLLLSTDSNQVAVGAFQSQTTSGAARAAVTQRHLATLKSSFRAHSASPQVLSSQIRKQKRK